MAEYQKIEYRIHPDGSVSEMIIAGTGVQCVLTTEGLEAALGVVENRQLLPEYEADQSLEMLTNSPSIEINQ